MDVCSPGEVDWALVNGWTPGEISYTGTNVTDRDLDRILAAGVHVNVDLLSQLERYGRRAPGTSVGVRVNPGIGATAKGAPSMREMPRPSCRACRLNWSY
jgi:diaminopimelate decarboxylase